MLPSKINRVVKSHFEQQQVAARIQPVAENYRFIWDSTGKTRDLSTAKSLRFYCVPLLLYTYSREETVCHLNQAIYINKILSELRRLHAQHRGRGATESRQVELMLLSLPSGFMHKFRNHFIVFPVPPYAGIPITRTEMYPTGENITVGYVVRDLPGQRIQRSGQVTRPVMNTRFIKTPEYSRTEFLREYVATFDYNLSKSCTELARAIFNEINL